MRMAGEEKFKNYATDAMRLVATPIFFLLPTVKSKVFWLLEQNFWKLTFNQSSGANNCAWKQLIIGTRANYIKLIIKKFKRIH